jgi:excinuclease ABC subunit A
VEEAKAENMNHSKIVIRGAKQHNLKNIDLEIPRNKFVVITGLSGSGKSSLAFDTIYAEGQRRYIESLSSYARQFLGQMDKPDVEYIDGLSPAIAIQQKGVSKNPRSTVVTVTEIHDYLRLLFARVGKPHCFKCGRPIERQSVQQIVDRVIDYDGRRVLVLAPVVRGQKGEHNDIIKDLRADGFINIRIDGRVHGNGESPRLDKQKKHTIEAVIDTVTVKAANRNRLADSIQTALKLAKGIVIIDFADAKNGNNIKNKTRKINNESLTGWSGKKSHALTFSEEMACPRCGVSIEELEPRMFSFNSPFGACRECSGLGVKYAIDPDLLLPDKTKSIVDGALAFKGVPGEESWMFRQFKCIFDHYGGDINTPIKDLDKNLLDVLLYGSKGEIIHFKYRDLLGRLSIDHKRPSEGLVNSIARRYRQTKSEMMREWYQKFMSSQACTACNGKRLRPEVLAVTISGKSIADVTRMSIGETLHFMESLKLSQREAMISKAILKEIKARLNFMMSVGLNYLTLDRNAGTLSGGESQRIQLATQIGSRLVGVLYILDEPSIGLHHRDNRRLISTLHTLRDIGNTVLVVEHDEETIRASDWVVDLGPGAGLHGGYVVACGTPSQISGNRESITGQYLSHCKKIAVPAVRRKGNGKALIIKGARENNLKSLDVRIPLGIFTCITGVSGSGKSTLVDEILHKALSRILYNASVKPGAHDAIAGIEHIDKVVLIDQSPIGRTPRSNPATYTGMFTDIRKLFTKLPESRARGYKAGRYSFNVKGGRCETCRGHGTIRLEMHFLPDVWVPCEVCKGKRFNRETLEVVYKGKNISEVLDMTVEEALAFFENIPTIKHNLQTLFDVGLGYIRLGQAATTLSGGEAQRVKLAGELSRRATGKTIYILDEPTTGLHFEDIRKLLDVLSRLVDAGNSVVVIEHNLDVIKTADHIIDLGPEGGDLGGYIVAEGTPENVVKQANSYTGMALKKVL